ncbi:MAG: hypothetical protein ACTSQG_00055 [Promethearchaeota archaeon]
MNTWLWTGNRNYKIFVNNMCDYKRILSHAFINGFGWPYCYHEYYNNYYPFIFTQRGNLNERLITSYDKDEFNRHPGLMITPTDFLNKTFTQICIKKAKTKNDK